MQTQPTQNQQISITEQVGALLPQLQQMACFTSFCAFKVKGMTDDDSANFERISDDLASVFFRLSNLYVTMSDNERKNIKLSLNIDSHGKDKD